MALNIKIDFNDCYPLRTLNDNLHLSSFNTVLKNGDTVPIGIHISEEMHPLIPNAYNLSFGPVDHQNQIDDDAKLYHLNHSKLFSTIVFSALTFLENKKDIFLGIDGSNNARAYMYYRCIQNNFDYLNHFMNIYGVNYYVRVLRKTDDESNGKLYNYFIFNAK